jgi:hypothetical protein
MQAERGSGPEADGEYVDLVADPATLKNIPDPLIE